MEGGGGGGGGGGAASGGGGRGERGAKDGILDQVSGKWSGQGEGRDGRDRLQGGRDGRGAGEGDEHAIGRFRRAQYRGQGAGTAGAVRIGRGGIGGRATPHQLAGQRGQKHEPEPRHIAASRIR